MLPPGFTEAAVSFGLGQDAAYDGGRQTATLAGEQDHELIFAPAGILAPQRQHGVGRLGRPSGLAAPPGPVGVVLEPGQLAVLETPPPAIARSGG